MTRHAPMDPERWRQVRDLVESAVELSIDERVGLLDEKCAGNQTLRFEVESLLEAYDAGSSLDQMAFDLDLGILAGGVGTTSQERPSEGRRLYDSIHRLSLGEHENFAGDTLGPYRILDELGHGGMGTVYLARREGNQDRRFAIKVAQHGLPRHVWQRFRTEYRILKGLDHPGIARVLDAGATDDGRPYFVMDYIEGTQIDEYCTERELPTPKRVELILKICDAVEAAHRQGVVHRDLKPSNILVTANGQPKLLDFGIAKLLEPEARSFTVESTRTNEHPLTPQYASPEQIRSGVITPRTDVYSLGVVLYKLLTGRLPYLLEHYTLVAMDHAFEEQAFPNPSAVIAAPGLEELGGDLDRIVMKALRVKAEDRFKTMGAFAQALSESLERRPSTARIAIDRVRRLRFAASRWLARRRRTVYALALAVVIVVLGVSEIFVEWPRTDAPPAAEFSFAEHDRIVIGFRNLTGEPILDDSLDIAFRYGFESSGYVRAVPRDRLRAALEDTDLGLDRETGIVIGLREGAKALVVGSVDKVKSKYLVSAEVIETASGFKRFAASAEATNQEVLVAALQEVCDDIRIHLGEDPEEIEEKGRLERVISTSLPALRAYSLGLEQMDTDDGETALGYFERAIAIDPGIAMAHAKLATVLWNRGAKESVSQHFSKAIQLPDRLTNYERLNVRARLLYFDGTLQDSIEAWTSMIRLYPENYVAYYNLSTVFSFQAYGANQSARLLEKVFPRVPEKYVNTFLLRLSWNYLTLGRLNEYESTVHKFTPHPNRARELQAVSIGLIFNRSDRQIEALLGEIRLADELSSFENTFAYYADFGRFKEIDELARPERSEETLSLGNRCLRDGLSIQFENATIRSSDLRQLLDEYRESSGRSYGKNFLKIQDLATLGKILARHGIVSEAETIGGFLKPFVELRRLPFWTSFGLVLEGEVLAANGRYDEAAQRFQEALEAQEVFQVHDSLAEIYVKQGKIADAIEESNWLVAHRGRALFEDSSHFVRVQNVISWHYAILRLARLHETLGRRQEAVEYYQRFVENWRDGDRPPVWHQARRRLESLLAESELSER